MIVLDMLKNTQEESNFLKNNKQKKKISPNTSCPSTQIKQQKFYNLSPSFLKEINQKKVKSTKNYMKLLNIYNLIDIL